MSQATAVSKLRVRYAETDQMGVAYHGNYFAWFELGRTDLLRESGYTYRELEAEGVRLPVIETQARFLRPALYDDVLEVRTRLVEMSRVRLTFAYEIARDGGELLATATTSHASVDARGRPRRLPESIRSRFA